MGLLRPIKSLCSLFSSKALETQEQYPFVTFAIVWGPLWEQDRHGKKTLTQTMPGIISCHDEGD